MRQTKRLLPLALVLTLLASASGCGGSSSPALAPTDYITMAMQSPQGEAWGLGFFPKTAGTQRCALHLGMPGAEIPGSCHTRVTLGSGDGATVRFVESWNARDFYAGSRDRGRLRHTWEIAVSRQAAGDHVVRSSQHGDFPPQLTR